MTVVFLAEEVPSSLWQGVELFIQEDRRMQASKSMQDFARVAMHKMKPFFFPDKFQSQKPLPQIARKIHV